MPNDPNNLTMTEQTEEKPADPAGLGQVLADPKRTRSDLNLVRRAVREGWPIAPEKRTQVIDRLMETVTKRSVAVMTSDGPQVLDGPADSNAISAARVLVTMDAINQGDYWNEDKNSRLEAGKPTEIIAGVEFIVPGLPTP